MITWMFEVALLAIVAWLTARTMHKRQQRRVEQLAHGLRASIPCMLRQPSQGTRWQRGKLVFNDDGQPPLFRPARGRPERALTCLQQTGLRSPSLREALTLNAGSRIIEFRTPEDDLHVAVMPAEVEQVLAALRTP